MLNIMLDLETLGTSAGCTILSVGAVGFDPDLGKVEKYGFYEVINRNLSRTMGFKEERATVEWWENQSEEAKKLLGHAEYNFVASPPHRVLRNFNQYLLSHGDTKDIIIWGNGSDFDNVILRAYYDLCGIDAPWNFRNNRCYRTLKNIYPDVKFERKGVAHDALDDARSQAEHAVEIFKHMRC